MTDATEAPAESAEELLAPVDAARMLGISVKQLARLADAGEVPVRERAAGRHRRYPAAGIRKLAREQIANKTERDLAAVAELAGVDPGQVKGWAVVVDDGTRQATVVTSMDPPACAVMLCLVADLMASGRTTGDVP